MIVNIEIPEDSRCLLKLGQKVALGAPYLENKINLDKTISISKELNIKPKKIFQFLKKFVGDKVKKDEVLAIKKNFFGEKKFLSPFDGIIKEIDHEGGDIVLTINEKNKKTYPAYFKGEVVDLKKDFFSLDIGRGEEFPIKKIKNNFGGEVFLWEEKKIHQLTEENINGKIIVANSISELIIAKIEALGAAGVVTNDKIKTEILSAQLKNQFDLEKLRTKNYSYCLVDKNLSKIYFYH